MHILKTKRHTRVMLIEGYFSMQTLWYGNCFVSGITHVLFGLAIKPYINSNFPSPLPLFMYKGQLHLLCVYTTLCTVRVFGPHRRLSICYSNFLTDLLYNHCFQSSAHRMLKMTWCTLSLITQFSYCLNMSCPTLVSLPHSFVETRRDGVLTYLKLVYICFNSNRNEVKMSQS